MIILTTFIIALNFSPVWALTSLEDLIKNTQMAITEARRHDPLDTLLAPKISPLKDDQQLFQQQLLRYRGTCQEGLNLQNICETDPRVRYPKKYDEMMAIKGFLNNLQFQLMAASMSAIAQYAQRAQFSEERYQNLATNLVHNYCSPNIHFLSRKKLLTWAQCFYGKKYELPSLEGNPFFPSDLSKVISDEEKNENEFFLTVEIFKSVCSWNNDIDDLRLLVPFVKNPIIAEIIFRFIDNEEITWNPQLLSSLKVPVVNENKILCRDDLCRFASNERFQALFPRGLGTKSIAGGLRRIWCNRFHNLRYRPESLPPKLREIAIQRNGKMDSLMAGQVLALHTKIPEIFLWAKNFSDLHKYTRVTFDRDLNQWANEQNERLSSDLVFEEGLSLELVDRKYYYNPYRPHLVVEFDVNVGDFDRAYTRMGKISLKFNLQVHKNILRWIRLDWLNLLPTERKKREEDLRKTLVHQISEYVERSQQKLFFPPWNNRLSSMVASEIIEQLLLNKTGYFNEVENTNIQIPVIINYSPFALKYIYYQFRVDKNFTENKY